MKRERRRGKEEKQKSDKEIYYGRNKGEAYKEIRLTFKERFFWEQEDEETGAVVYPSVLINGTPAKEEMIRWGTFDEAAHTVTAILFLPYADGGEAEYVLTAPTGTARKTRF